MKTLILNGSPRPRGDTAALIGRLTAALPGECRVVDAYRCGISPCVDCRYCRTHPGCAIQDGMQELYRYIEACDAVVIASPIYFSELTGKLLDLASRLQTYYSMRYFRQETPPIREKLGAVILVGGGDGAPDRALATARVLLRQMNAAALCEPVISHGTNTRPAAEDPQALAGIGRMAAFLRGEPEKQTERELK